MALAAYKIEDRDMMFASTVDFRLSLDFFDSGLYTCAAVARLMLALAKLSCLHNGAILRSFGCQEANRL